MSARYILATVLQFFPVFLMKIHSPTIAFIINCWRVYWHHKVNSKTNKTNIE